MDETTAAGAGEPVARFEPLSVSDLAELALGLAAVGVDTAGRVVERILPPTLVMAVVTAPARAALGRLTGRVGAADWSQQLRSRGRSRRDEVTQRTEAVAQRVAAAVVEAVLDLVDLTDLVIDHVDLDAVVQAVDLDRAVSRVDVAAIVDRVDVDAVVARADLDRAVSRVDIGAIVDRVDVDAIVSRVDVDAIVGRVDIDAIAARLDLDAILERVDVDAIASRLDLDAVVARLDLVALAEYVVAGIDLPGIIQSSSGAMASEGMREVRWQGVGADERVAHVVDRVLRRRPRTPGSAAGPGELPIRPVLPGPAG